MYYLPKLWKTVYDYATLVLIASAISARLAFIFCEKTIPSSLFLLGV